MRALALFSGGLDSMLAIKVVSMQNIEIIALHVNIGFDSKENKIEILRERAMLAGAKLEVIDVRNEYLRDILFSPKYGYGKQFNPCIDCHGFMFKLALELLPKYKADFIITGEVLGQRPMSQRSDAMRSVKKLAHDKEDLILRPLCAKLLEPTKPEKDGWVQREQLLDLNGRGRSIQLEMAKQFGWEDYASPAGGCLLTDVQFAIKMRDFLKYDSFTVEDIDVLKNGRHFRLLDGAKLVVGRDERENNIINSIVNPKFTHLHVEDSITAPSSLLSAKATQNDIQEACKIILSFTKAQSDKSYNITLGKEKIVSASPYKSRDDAKKYLL
ncbi:MAG: argininosuccinate synthase [Sulfurospirillaceae bacterium]|nr:argininosuccinate synthase [Sulfurospirillaceae bacterium]